MKKKEHIAGKGEGETKGGRRKKTVGRAGGVKFRGRSPVGRGVCAAVERAGRARAEPREASAWKVSELREGSGVRVWRWSMEAEKIGESGGW